MLNVGSATQSTAILCIQAGQMPQMDTMAKVELKSFENMVKDAYDLEKDSYEAHYKTLDKLYDQQKMVGTEASIAAAKAAKDAAEESLSALKDLKWDGWLESIIQQQSAGGSATGSLGANYASTNSGTSSTNGNNGQAAAASGNGGQATAGGKSEANSAKAEQKAESNAARQQEKNEARGSDRSRDSRQAQMAFERYMHERASAADGKATRKDFKLDEPGAPSDAERARSYAIAAQAAERVTRATGTAEETATKPKAEAELVDLTAARKPSWVSALFGETQNLASLTKSVDAVRGETARPASGFDKVA